MDLNLFENLKKDIESNVTIKNFMKEVSDFLNDMASFQTLNKTNNIGSEKEIKTDIEEMPINIENTLNEKSKRHRKDGHLYFVTEDRNNEIYLWDFTDKPKHEFKEIISSKELLSIAKEGAMLQYKNGKYELYSENGYNMILNEENNVSDSH